MMKKPYIIFAFPNMNWSAGNRTLHKLCHLLLEKGYDAYLTTSLVNKEWKHQIATLDHIQMLLEQGAIMVYPEIVGGNPYGASRVARYILNVPGLLGGDKTYSEEELLFCYNEAYLEYVPSPDRLLMIPVIELEIFNQNSGSIFQPPRSGGCFWVGKGYDLPRIQETEGLLEITREYPPTRKELANLFRRASIFYSYDNQTALLTEARLCGCPAVIIPNSEWQTADSPSLIGKSGIALGTSTEEIIHAKKTVPEFYSDYIKYVNKLDSQLDNFINVTQERWG